MHSYALLRWSYRSELEITSSRCGRMLSVPRSDCTVSCVEYLIHRRIGHRVPGRNCRTIQQTKGISMKRTWLWFLLASLTLGSASLSHAQQANEVSEKAVLVLEKQWLQSQKANNPDLLAPLLADKFVYTSTDGKVRNKAEILAGEKATNYSSAEYPELKVTVFGDTAIATIVSKTQYTDESGKPASSHSRWTDTWVKMPDGKWQCVASHGSDIEK